MNRRILRNLDGTLIRWKRMRHYAKLFRNPCGNSQAGFLKKAVLYLHVADLGGDYAEFGVYRGETLATAYHFTRQPNRLPHQANTLGGMRFFAFDSFEGLPAPTGLDALGFRSRDFHEGAYACDEERFRKNLRRRHVDLSRVVTVPGWFSETLTTNRDYGLSRVALAFIDCDLYESTVPVLDFLTERLVDGSIVAFDDWYAFRGNPAKGQQRAFAEWRRREQDLEMTQFQKFGWHGNSFIINRAA